jgi:hypothetical protein
VTRARIVCLDPPDPIIESASAEHLRFVSLECPLERWGDPEVRAAFNEIVHLKMLGFGGQYAAHVMPVDTTDFIGAHVLTCVEGADGLHLVAAFRTISCDRCRDFNLTFSAESLALQASAREHAQAVREFVGEDGRVGYLGSWTAHPSARGNTALRAALRDDFALGSILLHEEHGIGRMMVGATLRFKVDRLLAAVGFRPLALGGAPLPPIAVRHLHGEQVLLMCLDEVARDARIRTETLRERWRARVALGAS